MIFLTKAHNVIALAALALTLSGQARSAEVNLVGLFPGKALLEINKRKAKLMKVGETIEGVKLLSVGSDEVVVIVDGKRQSVLLGQSVVSAPQSNGRGKVTLQADLKGQFITPGYINGATTTFLVDTGATSIAMGVQEAKRLGISYLNGQPGLGRTASGTVPMYMVTLDTVTVGDITLNRVEAAIIDGDAMPGTLLGMSFLKRVEMRRQGTTLTLVQTY
jgi:aspartyl protease family protein